MIKIRMHRGGLQESMDTMKLCQSEEEVYEYLIQHGVEEQSIVCEHYSENDARIGWKSVYIILGTYSADPIKQVGPVAFTDSYIDIMLYNMRKVYGQKYEHF